MVAEHVTVIGQEHHHGVVAESEPVERGQHPTGLRVDEAHHSTRHRDELAQLVIGGAGRVEPTAEWEPALVDRAEVRRQLG